MTKKLINIRSFLNSRDAVSEVMDFVIILGILLLSLSAMGLVGYPILKNTQKNMNMENTRQSFIALAGDINEVALGQAPSKSVELNIYGGRIGISGSSTINITAKNSTGQTITLVDQQMRSIESLVGDATIAYEGTGAWINYFQGTTLNIYRPAITREGNALIIPVVNINGISSVSGIGMSTITVKSVPGISIFNDVSDIAIKIDSNYIDGWRNYFRDMSWEDCPTDECTVRLNSSGMDVYVLNMQLDAEVE